jgi:hypothetical protein
VTLGDTWLQVREVTLAGWAKDVQTILESLAAAAPEVSSFTMTAAVGVRYDCVMMLCANCITHQGVTGNTRCTDG